MLRLQKAGITFYLLGIIVLTLGVSLAIQSTLGTGPVDSVKVGLYRTFGFSIGTWEIVFGLSLILGNALVARQRPEFFALITSFITGLCIDSWLFLLNTIGPPEVLLSKWLYLTCSLVVAGIGVALYLQSNIAPNPVDRTMMVIANLTGLNVTYSRAILSIFLVIIAFFFNGDIGIGTLLNAIFVGVVINFCFPYAEALRKRQLAKFEQKAST